MSYIGRIEINHTCKPPNWYQRWRRGLKTGVIWQCDECDKQYILDFSNDPRTSRVHVAGAKYWPWMDTWPYKYELNEDGIMVKIQVSFPPQTVSMLKIEKKLDAMIARNKKRQELKDS